MLKVLHIHRNEKTVCVRDKLSHPPFSQQIKYTNIQDECFKSSTLTLNHFDVIIINTKNETCCNYEIQEVLQLRKSGYQGKIFLHAKLSSKTQSLNMKALGISGFIEKTQNLKPLFNWFINQGEKINPSKPTQKQFVGLSLQKIANKIPRIIDSGVGGVLVRGESGTGKEIVANILRSHLGAHQPMLSLNCATISDDLINSELFGHIKGAFTGAVDKKRGLIQESNGGWLYLDEVARLSLPTQAALLRTLENGEVRPVGSTHSNKVKLRVIASTNENLEDMIRTGAFRNDLLQRLNQYSIYLPSLAERSYKEKEEILDHLVKRFNERAWQQNPRTPKVSISSDAKSLLLAYNWHRGNVREMWNAIQAMAIDSESPLLTPSCLPKEIKSGLKCDTQISEITSTTNPQTCNQVINLTDKMDQLLVSSLEVILSNEGPQVSLNKASKLVGISRYMLKTRLQRLHKRGVLPPDLKGIFGI